MKNGLVGVLFLVVSCAIGFAEPKQPASPYELPLPMQIDAVVGREFNLWFDALWPLEDTTVDFELESELGTKDERCFKFMPEENQAGKTFPTTISVRSRESGKLVTSKQFKLRVLKNQLNLTGDLQLLVLGDSLTAGGVIVGKLLELTRERVTPRVKLLGRSVNGGHRHEGWGGWSFNSFVATHPGRMAARFWVAGLSEIPRQHMSYKYEDITYRVFCAHMRENAAGKFDGTVMFQFRPGDNEGVTRESLPPFAEKGSLAPLKEGPDTIEYQKVEQSVTTSPFWDVSLNGGEGGLNVRKYMRDHGNFGGEDRIDFVLIQLGVNDCFGTYSASDEKRAASLETITERCRTLIRALQSDVNGYPETRIILAIPPIGCNTPEIYESTYGNRGNILTGYERHMRDFWRYMLQEFDSSDIWPQVRIAINGLVTDRDNGYPKRSTGITDGKEERVHSNAVHPNKSGYEDAGEAYAAALHGWLFDIAAVKL